MKKVIFVGGTSYSGSTFLDMILANDPRGFSCGEVSLLFHSRTVEDLMGINPDGNPQCSCASRNCTLWQQVKKAGEISLYETIFELLPEVEFIVDSSKDPEWIQSQTKHLADDNVEVKNLLIWKTPAEFAYSYEKRGRLTEWEKDWIGYHSHYMTTIDRWRAVRYSKLAHDRDYLKAVCDYLDIDYFPGKAQYWNKQHHILFGNTSARINLYAMDSEHYKHAAAYLVANSGHKEKDLKSDYKTIHYKNRPQVHETKRLRRILKLLDHHDMLHTSNTTDLTLLLLFSLKSKIMVKKIVKNVVSLRRS